MAALDISTTNTPGKRKKASTTIDMTPLVDLEFLLITFFIFTTTLSETKAMRLTMPDDEQTAEPNKLERSKALTLLLTADNRIAFYEGAPEDATANLKWSSYSTATGIGAAIRDKQRRLGAESPELMVVIKATDAASYANVVDALDEMKINDVHKFAVVDISAEEKALLR